LADNSNRLLQAGFGLNHVESTFFEIVDLLKDNPFLKEKFLAKTEASMAEFDPATLSLECCRKS
jgi:hypothetical protein